MDEEERRAAALRTVLTVATCTLLGYAVADRILAALWRTWLRRTADTSVGVTAFVRATKVLGLLHALAATHGGHRMTSQAVPDMITSTSREVPFWTGISLGYMLCDTAAMARNWFEGGRVVTGGNGATAAATRTKWAPFFAGHWLFVAHHLAIAFVFIPLANWTSKGNYVVGRLAITELSSSFIYTRWFISELGWAGGRGGPLDVANSALLLGSWFVTRIWVFPALYLQLAESRNVPLADAVRLMQWQCHAGSAAILAPQLFWFGLMLKGLRKAAAKSKMR